MQDQSLIRTPAALLMLAALGAMLAGCQRDAVSAPATSSGSAAASPAYQLVTVVRPESIDNHVRAARGMYEVCTGNAEMLKLPVKPFVQVPQNFVAERLTQTSDGKSYYSKQQLYSVDIDGMTPQNGCQTRVTESVVLERIRNGKVEHIDIDKDGKQIVAEPGEAGPRTPRRDKLADYTVSRTEKGVALKCLPEGSPGLVPGMLTASCIIDAGSGQTLRDADGKPLSGYMRDEASGKQFSVLVHEPVSVSIGKADTAALSGPLK